jgi:photosystem II stability/assembly factor-like uncharacterized protein
MKSASVCLVLPLLFVLSVSTPSRADLRWLHPNVQGNTLRDVEFLDVSTAIAVGDAGTVLVSHDAGLTWHATFRTNGVSSVLCKVARVDDVTAVVVGGGVILRTTDAGTSWVTISSGTTTSLEDVDFAGLVGVAVGGTVMRRSTDGGDTWGPLPQSSYPIYGVDMVTSSIGYAVVDFNVLKTVDGGQTWNFTPQVIFALGRGHASFSDAMNGALATGAPWMYVTHDGGLTWEQHGVYTGYSESSAYLTDIEFVAPHEVFSSVAVSMCDVYTGQCSSGGEFFRSANDGAIWNYEGGMRVLNGVAVNDAGAVLLVGDAGVVHRWVAPDTWEQTAGVTHWNALPDPGRLAFRDTETGILLGSSTDDRENPLDGPVTENVVLRTSSGGNAWSFSYWGWPYNSMKDVVYPPGSACVHAVATQVSGSVRSSVLLESTDNGATWSPAWSAGSDLGLAALEFSSATHGVAVGAAGSAAVIDEGTVTTVTVATGIQNLAFADALAVAAVGGTGPWNAPVARIIRSADGGYTWSSIASPVTTLLYDVGFAGPSAGIAVGLSGTVLRTDDGGLTWSPIPSPTMQHLFAVAFDTGGYGIIVGDGGTVLESTDAGLTWSALEPPTTVRLTDVVVLAPRRALIAGPELMALEYRDNTVPTLFSSFDVTPVSFAAQLRWSVQDEANLESFRIMRRALDSGADAIEISRPDAVARAYRDENVRPRASYEYILVAVDRTGEEAQSIPVRVDIPAARVELLPNQPNPFNPSTIIRFVVPEKERVRLTVHDVAGRVVATLVDDVRDAGVHAVVWNGSGAASGVYFCRLRADKTEVSRKLVRLK